MKIRILSVLGALLFCALLISPAFAQTVPDSVSASSPESAAAQVTVSGITIDPEAFFEGDTGTISVIITNTGTEKVAIRRVTLYDNDITVLSNAYDTAVSLGAGNSMEFTFTVKADTLPGIYYPVFSVDFRDAGYLRNPITLKVENTPLRLSVTDRPDTFSIGKKDIVNISIGNPRDNKVSGVVVYPEGNGLDVTPSSYFIGTLDPDRSREISFSVTPQEPSDITFRVDYKNGFNPHTETLTLPLRIGDSKKQADPILSNIEIQAKTGYYSLTGDVTNAGLEVANSVVITTAGGVTPVDPYRSYVVGSLKPDDFSSFENTFTAVNVTKAEIIVSFKDSDGNLFTRSTMVDIPSGLPAAGNSTPIPLPVIALLAAIVVVIAAVIIYSWRRR
jgi:hypothetical protein